VTKTETITITPGQRGPVAIVLPPADESAGAEAPAGAEKAAPDKDDKAGKSPADAPPPDTTAAQEHPAASTPRSGPSALTIALAGVGVLGLGAGGLLTYWGKTDNSALSQCSPNCQPSSVAHIRALYLASDISFAAGAASLGVAAILFATRGSASAGKEHPQSAIRFDVQPMRSGAFATFQGGF
jgi:hypothetical protein